MTIVENWSTMHQHQGGTGTWINEEAETIGVSNVFYFILFCSFQILLKAVDLEISLLLSMVLSLGSIYTYTNERLLYV